MKRKFKQNKYINLLIICLVFLALTILMSNFHEMSVGNKKYPHDTCKCTCDNQFNVHERFNKIRNSTYQDISIKSNGTELKHSVRDSIKESNDSKAVNLMDKKISIKSNGLIPKHFIMDSTKPSIAVNVMNKDISMKFNLIAEKHDWGGGNETVSGPGSTLISTAAIRHCLGNWIVKYSIKSIVDIPCGDCNWQHAIPGIENLHYEGYDVSQYAIDRAKKKNPKWMFKLLDVTQSIPSMADLVVMRDFLQHLPLSLGKQALNNVFKSNSTWLGVSTYPGTLVNKNIKIGDYYMNNVLMPPFSLKQPTEICENYAGKEAQGHTGSKFYLIKL